jgi:hypothetical protein
MGILLVQGAQRKMVRVGFGRGGPFGPVLSPAARFLGSNARHRWHPNA